MNKLIKKEIILCCCLVVFPGLNAKKYEKQTARIMCYNVENFFDCVDDSTTNDNEFLAGGARAWNFSKYEKKQANITRVITALGGWDAPMLVGLCEVESERCLQDLTHRSGLKNLRYKFLHHESPDPRGIDVALLYQTSMFKPIHNEAIRIRHPDNPGSRTRDVLFASGILPTGDTLHVFVCHFPSRLGGEKESENKRKFVASVVRARVDSLFSYNIKANIVIMGDFNDYPGNASINKVLQALPLPDSIANGKLYNLMYKLHAEGKGSNKHLGEWGALDQIIVSGNLLNPTNTVSTRQETAHFFDADFLLENDPVYMGKQPFRTYAGMKYKGGYSDHLPVYMDVTIERK